MSIEDQLNGSGDYDDGHATPLEPVSGEAHAKYDAATIERDSGSGEGGRRSSGTR